MTTIQFVHRGIKHDVIVWYSVYLRRWCWSACGREDRANTEHEAIEHARRWVRDHQ